MSQSSAQVDCTDLAAFMARLGILRKADDSVIIELNDALPTQSFHPKNSRAKCEEVGKRLAELQVERLSLIERCLKENEERAKLVPEGSLEAKIYRNTAASAVPDLFSYNRDPLWISNTSTDTTKRSCTQDEKLRLLKECSQSPVIDLVVDLLSGKGSNSTLDWSSKHSNFRFVNKDGFAQLWSALSSENKTFISVVCHLKKLCKQRIPTVNGCSTRLLDRISPGIYRVFPDTAAEEIPAICPRYLRNREAERTMKKKPSKRKQRQSSFQRRLIYSLSDDEEPTSKEDHQMTANTTGVNDKLIDLWLSFENTPNTSSIANALTTTGIPRMQTDWTYNAPKIVAKCSGYTATPLAALKTGLPQLSADDVDEALFEMDHSTEPFFTHLQPSLPVQFDSVVAATNPYTCPMDVTHQQFYGHGYNEFYMSGIPPF